MILAVSRLIAAMAVITITAGALGWSSCVRWGAWWGGTLAPAAKRMGEEKPYPARAAKNWDRCDV